MTLKKKTISKKTKSKVVAKVALPVANAPVDENVVATVSREIINETKRSDLLWLLGELQRLNVRSLGDLENLIARIQ